MIAFIDRHREAYGVEPICGVLPIAPSTHHDHVVKRSNLFRLSDRAARHRPVAVGRPGAGFGGQAARLAQFLKRSRTLAPLDFHQPRGLLREDFIGGRLAFLTAGRIAAVAGLELGVRGRPAIADLVLRRRRAALRGCRSQLGPGSGLRARAPEPPDSFCRCSLIQAFAADGPLSQRSSGALTKTSSWASPPDPPRRRSSYQSIQTSHPTAWAHCQQADGGPPTPALSFKSQPTKRAEPISRSMRCA